MTEAPTPRPVPRQAGAVAEVLDDLAAGASRLLVHPATPDGEVEALAARLPARPDAGPAAPETPHLVLSTSGSTGRPKLLAHTRSRLEAAAAAQARRLGFEAGDAWATPLPPSSAGGLLAALRARVAGGRFDPWSGWAPEAVPGRIRRREVTHLSLAPAQLRDLLPREPPEALEAVLVGGGPCAELAARARRRGWPAVPSYGATEAPAFVAALPPDEAPRDPPTAGPPLPGVALRVAGPEAAGTLGFRSPHQAVARIVDGAYAPPHRDGWIEPGDRAVLEGGRLRVLGREDRAFLVGAYTVDPGEVEAALEGHPGVREAVVVALDHDRLGRVPAAAVEPAPDAAVSPGDLASWLEERLAGPKRPRRLRVVAIPRTPRGKPDREALRAVCSDGEPVR